jgi:protein-S-isoprenylcysteine O-methyltransferase Ste14
VPIIPAIILIAAGLYGIIHSLLASIGVKKAMRRTFGPGSDRYYRLAYNIFAVVSLIPVLLLPLLLPDEHFYTVPSPWSLVLLMIQALALLGLVIGVLQTGAGSFLGLRQLFEPVSNDSELVITGLYRWVRHPLYSAGIVFLWATPFMTRNLMCLYLGLTVYLIVGAIFEERKLLSEFGPSYSQYREQTPMFIPGLKGLKRQ